MININFKTNIKCILILTAIICFSCSEIDSKFKSITKVDQPIKLDGLGDESAWSSVDWQAIDQMWIGNEISQQDFSGKFKLLWNNNFIYILAETIDDQLIDIHSNGLEKYWDDDCLEVFIDADNSKGDHQYNYNAFAYHIALNTKVVDIGPDSIPQYYDHIVCSRNTIGKKTTWELSMKVFADDYNDNDLNTPVILSNNQKIGFAIAYCDNDQNTERENFIGSEFIEGTDKNKAWIDAGVFGDYILKEN